MGDPRRMFAGLLVTVLVLTAPGVATASGAGKLPPVETTHADRCDFLDQARCLLPFPNDYYTRRADTATGRQVALRTASMPANRFGVHMNAADYNFSNGFSAGQEIVTKVPGLDTPRALRRTGAVRVTNLGSYRRRDAPIIVLDADTGKRWPIFSEVDVNPPDPADRTLIVRPAVNFHANHRYIVVLRNLRRADGSRITASPAFRYYRDDVPSGQSAVERRRKHLESIFHTLHKAGIGRHGLYLAWDFTVESDRSAAGRITERFISSAITTSPTSRSRDPRRASPSPRWRTSPAAGSTAARTARTTTSPGSSRER